MTFFKGPFSKRYQIEDRLKYLLFRQASVNFSVESADKAEITYNSKALGRFLGLWRDNVKIVASREINGHGLPSWVAKADDGKTVVMVEGLHIFELLEARRAEFLRVISHWPDSLVSQNIEVEDESSDEYD